MQYQGERRDSGEQDPKGLRENIHRVFAGAASAVGQGVHQLHGLHAVNDKDRLNQEQAQDQDAAEHNGFRHGQGFQPGPLDFRQVAADHQGHNADADAGNAPRICRAAEHLGQDAPRAQKDGIHLARADQVGKVSGNTSSEDFRQIESNGHHAEEEKQVPGLPLVDPAEPVHDQNHGQHFTAFHDELGKGLQEEGYRIFQLAPDQHDHRAEIKLDGIHP